MQATCWRVVEAVDDITTMLDSGTNIMSIAKDMAHPAA
jgi:hypothetical protein